MGSSPNPLAGMVLSALQARSGAGMSQPGAGPMQQSGAPGGAGDEYSQMVSSLKGADPGGLLRQVKALKQITAVMLVQNLERLPNVASQLSKIIPMWDKVLKELQQASNVNAVVRNPPGMSPPIQMGAAQPPSPEGQPNPVGGAGLF